MFSSSGEGKGTPTLLGPLERANLNHCSNWRLTLSKGPNSVGVSLPSPEDGNRSSVRNFIFLVYLEFWTMDEVQKPSNSEY
jgi:hypothetical protein